MITGKLLFEDYSSTHPRIMYFVAYLRQNTDDTLVYDQRELASAKWYTMGEASFKFKGKRLKLLAEI